MAFCYAVVLQLSAWKAMWRQKLDRTRVFLRNLLSFGTPGAEGGSREGSSTIVQTVLCSHDGHCSGVSDLKTYCCNAEKAVIPPILSWGMGWDCPDIRESGGRITKCSTGGCEETDLWSIWYRIEEKLGSRLDFFFLCAENKSVFNVWNNCQYKRGSLFLPVFRNPRHFCLAWGRFSLSPQEPFWTAVPVNSRFVFTAQPYEQVHGTKSCPCKLAGLHCFERSNNRLCWLKIWDLYSIYSCQKKKRSAGFALFLDLGNSYLIKKCIYKPGHQFSFFSCLSHCPDWDM